MADLTRDRRHVITLLDAVWEMSQTRLAELVKHVSLKTSEYSKERIAESSGMLEGIIRDLLADDDYVRQEEPKYFLHYVDDIEEMYKRLFSAFVDEDMIEQWNETHADNPITDAPDDLAIDFLCRVLFSEIKRATGRAAYEKHTGITVVVRHVRNVQKHKLNRPRDHITGVETCGNIYTLVSILVLSIYGVIEVLEAWETVI